MAADPGLEPGHTDSKSAVLPLHKSAISNTAEGRGRTDMRVASQWFLRPSRLPIPPLRPENSIWSGRRGSNSRPPPWQGGILPLNYFRVKSAEGQNRTGDTRIFSPLLYLLSYLGITHRIIPIMQAERNLSRIKRPEIVIFMY